MSGFPKDAEALLSAAPDDFVTERNRLARRLRDTGRTEDAAAVVALRKPPPVVLAANRAARSRPQVAKDTAREAKRVRKELGFDAEARKGLNDALKLLEDVALAFLGQTKAPSEATRRRLHDLLQNAVADDDALHALTRGVLTEEPQPAGFGAYTGAKLPPRTAPPKRETRAREAAQKERQELEQALQDEVAAAEQRLEATADAEKKAVRDRTRAERELEAARRRLERLE